jgi:glyoxylase-like metal-dependent hydrolase (beta-lactamase superfamily II)
MEFAPYIHLVPEVIANPYLIMEGSGITLIDTGLPGSHSKILKYLEERGFLASDVKRIILTHSDMDHVGGLAALKLASGARTFASAIEAAAISQGRPSRRIRPTKLRRRLFMALVGRFYRAAPVKIDEIISEGQVLDVLGGLQVLETPGHTPGHISLFAPAAGVLFVGDSIISRDGSLIGSVPANTWDQTKASESVRKQTALGARVICCGHGPVVVDAADKMPIV